LQLRPYFKYGHQASHSIRSQTKCGFAYPISVFCCLKLPLYAELMCGDKLTPNLWDFLQHRIFRHWVSAFYECHLYDFAYLQ
jgi:hypothetical protein